VVRCITTDADGKTHTTYEPVCETELDKLELKIVIRGDAEIKRMLCTGNGSITLNNNGGATIGKIDTVSGDVCVTAMQECPAVIHTVSSVSGGITVSGNAESVSTVSGSITTNGA
jgi:DUF4097 and DUF4098 domain-containing protein YvlB